MNGANHPSIENNVGISRNEFKNSRISGAEEVLSYLEFSTWQDQLDKILKIKTNTSQLVEKLVTTNRILSIKNLSDVANIKAWCSQIYDHTDNENCDLNYFLLNLECES